MYARVAEFDNPRLSDPSLVDELTSRARDSSTQWQDALPDAQGHLMLIDRDRGRAFGITFFGSEAQIREAEPVFERMGEEVPEDKRGKRVGVTAYEVMTAEAAEGAQAARVTTLEGDPSRLDEATQSAVTVLPHARQMAGWRGVFTLVDRQSGRELLITLWESAESMQASEEQASRLRSETAEAGGQSIAGVDRYQVALAVVPTEAQARS